MPSSIALLRYSDAVRSISESSRLGDDVHAVIPVCVEGGSAFHLVADRHRRRGAGERMHQELVLVYPRARSMT